MHPLKYIYDPKKFFFNASHKPSICHAVSDVIFDGLIKRDRSHFGEDLIDHQMQCIKY